MNSDWARSRKQLLERIELGTFRWMLDTFEVEADAREAGDCRVGKDKGKLD
jgi:hypothetical protein